MGKRLVGSFFVLGLCLCPCVEQAASFIASFPEPIGCLIPSGDLDIAPEENRSWNPCEKFVWSCVRAGLEANLFTKQCYEPRSQEAKDARPDFAPFYLPERYETSNGLTDRFLRTLLWTSRYAHQIPPPGIRIFGAYFKDPVNFENVKTDVNLVLDGTMARRGIRLSNFGTKNNVSFDSSNIRGPLYMMRTNIAGSLFLDGGVFDLVDLRDARIGASIEAERSVFNDLFYLDRAHVESKANFAKSRFTILTAHDANIGGFWDMRLGDVRLRLDLARSTIGGDVLLQKLLFGREISSTPYKCDWDPAVKGNYVLREVEDALADEPGAFDAVWRESVENRPKTDDQLIKNPCEPTEGDTLPSNVPTRQEVVLRDMKIGGTLCLIDVTGEIATKDAQAPRRSIKAISLDGTQTASTVLRWKRSESTTQWRAANFRTGSLFINLYDPPSTHYIDNFHLDSIAFLKPGREPREAPTEAKLDPYVCNFTPNPDNVDPPDDLSTQQRLVAFFTGSSNTSGSAQPFASVVSRLEESGVNSTYLRTALSEYEYRNLCQTSLFAQRWRDHRELSAPSLATGRAEAAPTTLVDEGRKLFLDGLCMAGLAGYKYTVSYGHEPHNLFFFVAGFIILFWILLKFDAGPGPKLGLIYAIDTFLPASQVQLDRRNAGRLPNSSWLRAYLGIHRVLGLVFSILLLLLVFNAAR